MWDAVSQEVRLGAWKRDEKKQSGTRSTQWTAGK